MNRMVGYLRWDACIGCVHHNKEEGGCIPIEKDG